MAGIYKLLAPLTPEQYQDVLADLIQEIEGEGERKRDGNSVVGVDKILSQNPLEPPTRLTTRARAFDRGARRAGGSHPCYS